jgi:O-antigen/teichoic acid export membrane protein
MNFTNFVHGQSDTALTAYYLGPAQTGIYGSGKRIGLIVSNVLSTPLGRVAMPALASIQDDNARMQRAYLQAIGLTVSLTAPAFAGMAALAPDLVRVMLGARWAAAAPVLAALAANYFLITIGQYNFSVLLVKGKPHWLSAMTAIYAVVSLALLLVVVRYGVLALAVAISVRTVLLSPISTTLSLRVLGLKWRDYLGAIMAPIVCAVAMGVAVALAERALSGVPAIARMALLVSSGAVAYGILLFMVRPQAVRDAINTVLQALGRGRQRS